MILECFNFHLLFPNCPLIFVKYFSSFLCLKFPTPWLFKILYNVCLDLAAYVLISFLANCFLHPTPFFFFDNIFLFESGLLLRSTIPFMYFWIKKALITKNYWKYFLQKHSLVHLVRRHCPRLYCSVKCDIFSNLKHFRAPSTPTQATCRERVIPHLWELEEKTSSLGGWHVTAIFWMFPFRGNLCFFQNFID